MRIFLTMIIVIAASTGAGFAVRSRDPIAAVLLFLFAAAAAAVLAGAFFGWFGP